MNSKAYRSWAEIDQSALRHNAEVVRKRVGPDVELLAVVKANGYGHGMVGVAKALAQNAHFFGVANLEEATILRGEVAQPIMILGPALPAERSLIAEGGFIPSISTLEEAREFERAAQGRPVAINFVIDTGMGRMGVPQAEAIALFKKVVTLANIKVHSLSTHLPVSNEDVDFTRAELRQFADIVKRLRSTLRHRSGRAHPLRHLTTFGISKISAACADLENADRFDSRYARWTRNQLRAHLHHAPADARGDAFGRLCRRVSEASFESRNGGSGSGAALCPSGTDHDGFDDDRCFARRERGGGRRGCVVGATRGRGDFRDRAG